MCKQVVLVNKAQNKNKLRGNAPNCVVLLFDRCKHFCTGTCLPCALCKQRAQYLHVQGTRSKLASRDRTSTVSNFIVLKDNGDLVYNRGFTIAAIQHAELPAFAKTAGDDSKYVTALLQMIFGIEVLAVSSITDKTKKKLS
jgi:hypothetical protein